MPTDLITHLPAWGIFAMGIVWMTFQFISKDRAKTSAMNITPDAIAAVIKDQSERQEILDQMRSQSLDMRQQVATLDRIAAAQEQMATAQEQLARTEERQTALLEESARRTDQELYELREDTRKIKTMLAEQQQPH